MSLLAPGPVRLQVYVSLPKLNAGCTKTVAVERRRVRPDGTTFTCVKNVHAVIRRVFSCWNEAVGQGRLAGRQKQAGPVGPRLACGQTGQLLGMLQVTCLHSHWLRVCCSSCLKVRRRRSALTSMALCVEATLA